MGIPGKQGSIGAPNSVCMFAGLLEMSSLEQTQTKPPNSLGTFFGFLGLLQDVLLRSHRQFSGSSDSRVSQPSREVVRVEGSGEMVNGRDEEGRGAGRRFSLGKSKVGGREKKREAEGRNRRLEKRGCLAQFRCADNN